MKKINKNPSIKELRQFGVIILVGFGIVGALFMKCDRGIWAILVWMSASVVCVLALVSPRNARPIYVVWMTVGMAVGFVVSRIVLTLIYFGLFTPVAFFFRLRGRDELRLKKETRETYWQDHSKISEKTYYDHIF